MRKQCTVEAARQRIIARFKDLYNEIWSVGKDVYTFERLVRTINDKGIPPGNQVYHWLVRVGLRDLLMAFRRINDRNKLTISIPAFLNDLKSNATIFTRDWFCESFAARSSIPNDDGHDYWLHLFPRNPSHLPASKVEDDFERITSLGDDLIKITDKYVAHRERNPRISGEFVPLQLYAAFGEIEKIILWYQGLFEQGSPTRILAGNIDEIHDDIDEMWG